MGVSTVQRPTVDDEEDQVQDECGGGGGGRKPEDTFGFGSRK